MAEPDFISDVVMAEEGKESADASTDKNGRTQSRVSAPNFTLN